MSKWRRFALPISLVLAGLALLAGYFLNQSREPGSVASSVATPSVATQPTRTPEPIFPTRTRPVPAPAPGSGVTATDTRATAAEPADFETPSTPLPQETSPSEINAGSEGFASLSRFGLSGRLSDVEPALAAGLLFGSFYNWGIVTSPLDLPGIDFWQTVRVSEQGIQARWEDIAAAAAANPGSVWMIGNEPDVIWQDNVTPERYATLYHEAYSFITSKDPAAQLAIGGVAMPTPLRRAYLDRVLETYLAQYGRPMPVDIWNVHAYILREEAGSWGVEIPPGMDAYAELGRPYEVADHADIEIFKQNLLEFRAWMAARGYGDRPLAVTEFGVLMPADYGFPQEANGQFMREAITFMATAANDTGYPADGGKLVQWWFWYSLLDTVGQFSVADLYDPELDRLTYLGQVWTELARER